VAGKSASLSSWKWDADGGIIQTDGGGGGGGKDWQSSVFRKCLQNSSSCDWPARREHSWFEQFHFQDEFFLNQLDNRAAHTATATWRRSVAPRVNKFP